MAVKDSQYRYFPSQERLVNVSNYMINPNPASLSPDDVLAKCPSKQSNAYMADSFRYGGNETSVGSGVEASADFEMKNVRWTEETFTVSDLLSLRLPVIVKVVKGYYGNDGQQLTNEQILHVCKFCEQLRVTATDSNDRTLSLPINCPISVRSHSGSHRSGQAQPLSELLENVSLPANIEVIGVNRKNGQSPSVNQVTSSLSDSRLTLREISQQKFLVANAIKKGWLDQSNFLVIPEQLKLSFRMASGIRQATAEEWKDVCGMYSRAARHLKFHLINGYEGVVYDDWVIQEKPLTSDLSPAIESDREEPEADNESDSDSALKTTRSRFLWQQTPLTQGSLPSLPAALMDGTTGSDPGPESPASGSVTPSHLSNESLQPCKSTESLLPRGSVDYMAVGKETASKRKSNIPSRFLRRKAEPKKQATRSATVPATEFELKSGVPETIVPSQKNRSVPCSSSTSRSIAPDVSNASVSRLSEQDDTCNADNAPDSVFDEPSWKDTITRSTRDSGHRESMILFGPESSAGQKGHRSPYNPENVSLDDVMSASLDDVIKKWRKNDCRSNLRGSSDDALLGFRSADGQLWSPVLWSSDLCIASSSELEMTRMKRSAMLSRDLGAYRNAMTGRPLSPNRHSTPLQSPSKIQSLGVLDSTQSLFSSTSTDLSARHRGMMPGVDRVPQGHRSLSSEDSGVSKARAYNDAEHQTDPYARVSTPHSSTGHDIAKRPDDSNPPGLGVNRSRKLSNGLVKMRLDQNGTVLSSGSEVIDDGYSTKGNSMTSSLETFNGQRPLHAGREAAYYI